MAHLPFGIHGPAFSPRPRTHASPFHPPGQCSTSLFLAFCQSSPRHDSDVASAASFAIFQEADIASSVSKAREDEHEPQEELSWTPDRCPTALDDSNLCKVLALSLPLSSAAPVLVTPGRSATESLLVLHPACSSCPPSGQPKLLVFRLNAPLPPLAPGNSSPAPPALSSAPPISPCWR